MTTAHVRPVSAPSSRLTIRTVPSHRPRMAAGKTPTTQQLTDTTSAALVTLPGCVVGLVSLAEQTLKLGALGLSSLEAEMANYRFDVTISTHDLLKAGVVEARHHRVVVAAPFVAALRMDHPDLATADLDLALGDQVGGRGKLATGGDQDPT